jgi:hypothetical protein
LDFVAITLPFDCFLLEAMNSLLVLQPTTLYACICWSYYHGSNDGVSGVSCFAFGCLSNSRSGCRLLLVYPWGSCWLPGGQKDVYCQSLLSLLPAPEPDASWTKKGEVEIRYVCVPTFSN